MQTIRADASFNDLIALIRIGKRNLIAVVNEEHQLEGVINLDDIRPIMFNKELYESMSIESVMTAPPAIINMDDNMRNIVKKFDETATWTLPVVEKNRFIGFISKSSILNRYRQLLQEYSV